MSGKLYALSTGPGAADLITVRAAAGHAGHSLRARRT